MPIFMSPAAGVAGPVRQKSPLDALAEFLGANADQSTPSAPSDAVSGPDQYPTAPNRTEYDFGNGRTGSFTGLSRDTLATPYEQSQAADAAEGDARDTEKLKAADALNAFFNPDAERQRQEQLSNDVTKAVAPVEAQSRGALNVERQKDQTALDIEKAKADAATEIQRLKNEGLAGKKVKLSNTEQATLDAVHAMVNEGEPLLRQMEQQYPGIAENPDKYSTLSHLASAKAEKAWYSLGGQTKDDSLYQQGAAIQAWGLRQLAQGRINQSMMDIINAHLPQPGYTPGANYDRLNRLLHVVLPAQVEGIGQAQTFDPSNPLAGFGGDTGDNSYQISVTP